VAHHARLLLADVRSILSSLQGDMDPYVVVPVFVDLSVHCRSSIQGLLHRVLTDPGLGVGLPSCEVDSLALQDRSCVLVRLLVILDNFDDLIDDGAPVEDLYSAACTMPGSVEGFRGVAKFVVMSRPCAIPNDSPDLSRVFGEELVIAELGPMSGRQVDSFIVAGDQKDRGGPGAGDYKRAFSLAPSIAEVAGNPFVLRQLVLKTPRLLFQICMEQFGVSFHLYESLVSAWFDREVQRMRRDRRDALVVEDVFPVDAAVASLHASACLLAWEMVSSGSTVVNVNNQDGAPMRSFLSTGPKWLEFVASWARQLRCAVLPTLVEKRNMMEVMSQCDSVVLAELPQLGPFAGRPDSLQFLHPSLVDYFCARLIVLSAGGRVPLDARVKMTSEFLGLPGNRDIRNEKGVLRFLHVFFLDSASDLGAIFRAEACLASIARSTRSSLGRAAGNAAAILEVVSVVWVVLQNQLSPAHRCARCFLFAVLSCRWVAVPLCSPSKGSWCRLQMMS
jgi:hypothetical protein